MRWILYILIGLLLTLAITLGTVRFAPATAIAVANTLQKSVRIEAEHPTFGLFPPDFAATSLSVDGAAFTLNGKALALSTNAQHWWNDAPFWSVQAEHITVVTRDTQDGAASEEASDPTGIDLAPAFTFKRIDIDTLTINDQTFRVTARNDNGALNANITSDILTATVSLDHQHAHDFSVAFNQNDVGFEGTGTLQTLPQPEIKLSTGTFKLGATTISDLTTHVSCAPAGFDCEIKRLQANAAIENMAPFSIDIVSTMHSKDGGLAGTLSGTLDALLLNVSGSWINDVATFDINTSADTWPEFLPIAHYAPQALAPFDISAQGSYSTAGFKLQAAHIVTPSHDARATASIDLAEASSVSVNIDAQRLHIPLLPAEDAVEPETAAENATDQAPLLSAEPLDWSWLDQLTLTATLSADVLQLEDAVFNAFSLTAQAADGLLNVQTGSGDPADGGFAGSFKVERNGSGVNTTADFHLNRIALETFGFVPQEELTGGSTELLLSLSSMGASPAELGAHAKGEMYAIIEDAVLQNDMVEIIGSDIIMEALEKLNPFVKDDPSTNLECALVRFETVDGTLKSKDQLVIETDKMEIVGSGSINLANEALKITFSPSAKSGVGVNAGSLVSFLAVGGTIRNPGLTVDALGTLKTGASIGAAISTGGASLLAEGLLKRAANAGSACEAFRKKRISSEP